LLCNRVGLNALHLAASQGEVTLIKRILRRDAALVNIVTREGVAPLHLAARSAPPTSRNFGSAWLSPVLRIRDVYPGSRILIFTHPGSRIPDPGSKNSKKREGRKKICCHNFICSHKFHQIANYFCFEVLKKKIWVNFQRIIELFTQKIVTKLSKIWVWYPGCEIRDPGSRKNLFRIPDPGVKKAPDPGSGSATLTFTTDPDPAFYRNTDLDPDQSRPSAPNHAGPDPDDHVPF
jgi:hypothetical protein